MNIKIIIFTFYYNNNSLKYVCLNIIITNQGNNKNIYSTY